MPINRLLSEQERRLDEEAAKLVSTSARTDVRLSVQAVGTISVAA